MVKPRDDYTEDAIEAARSVLLELVRLLDEYRDDMVIVGGWVPELLLSAADEKHIGSNDVDLAFDHRKITEARYRTILEHLKKRGYVEGRQPYVFLRTLQIGRRQVTVEVDLLSGEYGGTGKTRRHQAVQDVKARKTRGCDLAFEDNTEVVIEGTLPTGGKDRASVRVAGMVPFLTMKAMALAGRIKEKDAWDICFCVRHYPGGPVALAERFRPHLGHKLVQEGLRKLREKFGSPEHIGPKWVADFDELTDAEARAIRQRDAFERVDRLLSLLGY